MLFHLPESNPARSSAKATSVPCRLTGPVSLLPFEQEEAKIAVSLRAVIEAAGKPIAAYDLLIAAQALRHRLTLVTANAREFRRIESLRWEDWGKA